MYRFMSGSFYQCPYYQLYDEYAIVRKQKPDANIVYIKGDQFTNELIALAKEKGIDYAADVYPSYSSDTATALRAGNDIRFALIGTGVFASHGYERTHVQGIDNTCQLILAVLDA